MKPLLILFTLLTVSSCGGDEKTATLGEMCDQLGTDYCARVAACTTTTSNTCFQAFKSGCCLNAGKCYDDARDGAQEDYDKRCKPAIAALQCAEVQTATLPAACLMNR